MSMVRGDWLNPASNPYIKSVADAAISPVQDAFNKNKLAVSDRAIAEGAYGGARQDLQQNKLVNDAAKTMGDITSGIYYNN